MASCLLAHKFVGIGFIAHMVFENAIYDAVWSWWKHGEKGNKEQIYDVKTLLKSNIALCFLVSQI